MNWLKWFFCWDWELNEEDEKVINEQLFKNTED